MKAHREPAIQDTIRTTDTLQSRQITPVDSPLRPHRLSSRSSVFTEPVPESYYVASGSLSSWSEESRTSKMGSLSVMEGLSLQKHSVTSKSGREERLHSEETRKSRRIHSRDFQKHAPHSTTHVDPSLGLGGTTQLRRTIFDLEDQLLALQLQQSKPLLQHQTVDYAQFHRASTTRKSMSSQNSRVEDELRMKAMLLQCQQDRLDTEEALSLALKVNVTMKEAMEAMEEKFGLMLETVKMEMQSQLDAVQQTLRLLVTEKERSERQWQATKTAMDTTISHLSTMCATQDKLWSDNRFQLTNSRLAAVQSRKILTMGRKLSRDIRKSTHTSSKTKSSLEATNMLLHVHAENADLRKSNSRLVKEVDRLRLGDWSSAEELNDEARYAMSQAQERLHETARIIHVQQQSLTSRHLTQQIMHEVSQDLHGCAQGIHDTEMEFYKRAAVLKKARMSAMMD